MRHLCFEIYIRNLKFYYQNSCRNQNLNNAEIDTNLFKNKQWRVTRKIHYKKKTINHFSTESHHHKNPSRKIIPAYDIFHQKKNTIFSLLPPNWNSNDSNLERVSSNSSRFHGRSFILRVKSLAGRNVFGDEKFRLYDVHDNNYEAQPQLRSRINSSFIDRICLSSCRQRRLVQYASVPARITRPGKWNWLEPSFSLRLRSAIISFIFIPRSLLISPFLPSLSTFRNLSRKLAFEKGRRGFRVKDSLEIDIWRNNKVKSFDYLKTNNFKRLVAIGKFWILRINYINCFENYVTHKNWHIN